MSTSSSQSRPANHIFCSRTLPLTVKGDFTGVNEERRQKVAALRGKEEAEQRAEQERAMREQAEQEATSEKWRSQRALREKIEAEQQANTERKLREIALHEKSEAEQRAVNEQMIREKVLQERMEAEEIKEKALLEKSEADRRAQWLLNEKEEQEKLEAEQKMFKWGPRKNPDWTGAEIESLQKFVYEKRKDSEGNDICLKLLVFGPTGHGKSSFCNGCKSALEGDDQPSSYFSVASLSHSLTSGFHGAPFGEHWIIDMAGIFESNKISSVHIENIASGNVPFYADLTDTLEVKGKSKMEIPAPGENDVSCVVIVLRYDAELGPELRRQIEVIVGLAGKGVISYHLVLTRLDECDPEFNDTDNIPNMYKSAKVQAAVKRMSDETGIPPLSISFVRNYSKETETDNNSSLLHLRAVERIIKSALDQVEKRLNKQRQMEVYFKQNKIKGGEASTTDQKKAKQIKEESPTVQEQGKQVNDSINVRELMFMVIVLLFAVLVLYFKK